jgi:hypothetical protein
MHLDPERIQRLLHAELDADEYDAVHEHLAHCEVCRGSVAEARGQEEEIFGLLEHLDHPQPVGSLNAIVEAAAYQRVRWGRWVAGIVLTLGATSAAYAAPGSPVPGWVRQIVETVRPPSKEIPDDPALSRSEAGSGGISVPAGSAITLRFSVDQPDGQATVSLTAADEVVIQAIGGSVAFTSGPGRVLIQNEGSNARFEIEIPNSAPRIDIRVGDRVIFSKADSRIDAEAPPDSLGRYRLSLGAPRILIRTPSHRAPTGR